MPCNYGLAAAREVSGCIDDVHNLCRDLLPNDLSKDGVAAVVSLHCRDGSKCHLIPHYGVVPVRVLLLALVVGSAGGRRSHCLHYRDQPAKQLQPSA